MTVLATAEVKGLCGICEPMRLRSGVCDYHLREIGRYAASHHVSIKEATEAIYTQAVQDVIESEGKDGPTDS